MRVRFLKDIVVDPLAMPERARGALMMRVPSVQPVADPSTGMFSMPAVKPLEYYFPRGRITELDREVALYLIVNDNAEAVDCDRGDVVWESEHALT